MTLTLNRTDESTNVGRFYAEVYAEAQAALPELDSIGLSRREQANVHQLLNGSQVMMEEGLALVNAAKARLDEINQRKRANQSIRNRAHKAKFEIGGLRFNDRAVGVEIKRLLESDSVHDKEAGLAMFEEHRHATVSRKQAEAQDALDAAARAFSRQDTQVIRTLGLRDDRPKESNRSKGRKGRRTGHSPKHAAANSR